jgi:CheY-like chemotaxis protein
MPGPVKSRDLAREAQALRPELPILYTSGYSEDVIVHQGRLDEGVQLLSKPYTREDLARKIGGLLRRHKPVVLVVEDDPLVRMATVDMVKALGFAVLQAEDAPAALSLLGQADPIDVLFTDVGLPGVRGPELAVRARGLRPDLKVIFASGYSDVADGNPIPGATHLRKPYEQEELAEALGVG